MEWIESLLSNDPLYGYLGIIVILILTGAGLPIPEEVPIVAAGVFSADGSLNIWWAFASCLVGALLGDTLVYIIGRYLGHGFFRRHPRFAHLLHEEREQQMEQLIKRHGLKIFFAARFMVGVRAPIYLAAGVLRVPWRRFIIVDAISATVVVSVVFWLSYVFGKQIGDFVHDWQLIITIVALVAITIFLFFFFRHKSPPAELATDDQITAENQKPDSISAAGTSNQDGGNDGKPAESDVDNDDPDTSDTGRVVA